MKATVREYTVKKRVITVQIDMEEVSQLLDPNGPTTAQIGSSLCDALNDAIDADRASDAKEDEDVPF